MAAGLLAYDSEVDYVSDVFVGPRKDPLERAIAVDYTRHGIELHRWSETELAAIFNAELSRAVRYEDKRSEAAQRIISMHKRHGEVVARVLEQKVAENAPKLVGGNLNDTSLLALVIGQKFLRHQWQLSAQAIEHGSAKSDSVSESLSSAQSQSAALARVRETLDALHAKFDALAPGRNKVKKKRKPVKRDTVLFAAILMGFKGMRYCSFLQDHGIKPKWSDVGPASYPKSYQAETFRKKVQDEKARAKARMAHYADAEFANALNAYLPAEFDVLSPLLRSRNSRDASKNPRPMKPHKH